MMKVIQEIEADDHEHHRFGAVWYRGEQWDLSHLDPFAFRIDPALGFEIDVVVLFTCHCFTRGVESDGRAKPDIPAEEWYDDGRERRVLCPERYACSKGHLRGVVKTLPERRITVANEQQGNFITVELLRGDGHSSQYAVFFVAEADRIRRKRVLLRVQSAYILEGLTRRQEAAKKVGFDVLIRKAYVGERVRP